MSQDIIIIDEKITIDDIIQVSRYNKKVELSLDSIKRIKKARNYIDEKTYSGTLTIPSQYVTGSIKIETPSSNSGIPATSQPEEENPETFDSITNSILMGAISLIGLIGATIYLKRRNKVRV